MHILRWLDDHLEEFLVVALMSVMTVFICGQVFTRYVLETAMSWTEEISRYMFIWLVYVGISYGVKKQKHISVDVIHNFLPPKLARYFEFFGDFLFLGFALFIVGKGTEVFLRIIASGQTSPACEIPMWLVYGALPFGMALSSFRLLQNIYHRVKELRATNEQSGQVE